MMRPEAIMIFAAGRGTRMGPLTADRPKPLIPVAGRPLLDHALTLAQEAGPLRRVVNVHYLGGMIRDHLSGQDVAISDESEALLETGGGLRKALPLLGPGPVLTLNSDAVWRGPNPLGNLIEAWDGDRMEGLLLLIPQERALGHRGAGDFVADPGGRLARGPGLVYSGAQILRPDGLSGIAEDVFSLNRLWDAMIRRGRLYGVTYAGDWCDVGQPQSIPLAERLLGGADVR